MSLNKSLLRLLAVTLLFVCFAGYNFTRAYLEGPWSPPGGSPPTHNVAAPLTHGTSTTSIQLGSGNLGFDQFTAFNQVNAAQYCDVNGANCTNLGGSGTTTSNFGGMYALDSARGCADSNPLTGSCSCPASYNAVQLTKNVNGSEQYLYYCMTTPAVYTWSVGGYVCSAAGYSSGDSCSWTHTGTLSRTVTCLDGGGGVVADSNCPSPKPATTGGTCTRSGTETTGACAR